MKKFICLTVCIFFILLIGGSLLLRFKDLPKYGLLRINGVDIAQENVIIHSNYAELPLLKVMKSLNMTVDWIDGITATIICKDKKYTLDLSKVSLVEVGQNTNILLPPPGGNRFYTLLEKELILDSNTIKSVFYQMGIQINIDISHNEQIVYIFDTP